MQKKKWCVRVQNIWEAAVGEVLSCVREMGNARDRYAVTVENNGTSSDICPEVSRVYPKEIAQSFLWLHVTQ